MPSGKQPALLIIAVISANCLYAGCSRHDAEPERVSLDPMSNDAGPMLSYRRAASDSSAKALTSQMKPLGAPGVALFDADGDGDLDAYVTNGPGADNGLYLNQLRESGRFGFVEGARAAGAAATDQDSTGVCYGDIDNDGDQDLLVLGNGDGNRLFLNEGRGHFTDVSRASGVGGGRTNSVSCSFGDVNGDGRIDVVIANTFDMKSIDAIGAAAFELSEPNQLLVNRGDGTFEDVSATSGIWDLDFPKNAPLKAPAQAATISWSVALVDFDGDGDVDLFQADDQGALPNTLEGGIDRGFPHVLVNDGSGHFHDITFASGISRTGGWMGLSFADFNRDGLLDFFGTNFGNHTATVFHGGVMPEHQEDDSRWFLQQADGSFKDAFDIVGRQNSPFGWGTVAEDFDNDGDSDVVYFGGEDLWLFIGTTPAAAFINDGHGALARSEQLFGRPAGYLRRAVNGVAAGDLNEDGFADLVTVSSFDLAGATTLTPSPRLGGPWDHDAFYVPVTDQVMSNLLPGSLELDLNDAASSNGSLQLELVGSVGLLSGGRANRDGIGALVSVRAEGSDVADLRPVVSGASYASQGSLLQTFGLASASSATVTVRWPGGTKNRLTGVRRGERLKVWEMPCSTTTKWASANDYSACVDGALTALAATAGVESAARSRLRELLLAGFAAGEERAP